MKTGTWSPEGIARPTDQSVAQAIRALSPLRAGGSAGVWFDNTMLEYISILKRLFAQSNEHVHAQPIKSW